MEDYSFSYSQPGERIIVRGGEKRESGDKRTSGDTIGLNVVSQGIKSAVVKRGTAVKKGTTAITVPPGSVAITE